MDVSEATSEVGEEATTLFPMTTATGSHGRGDLLWKLIFIILLVAFLIVLFGTLAFGMYKRFKKRFRQSVPDLQETYGGWSLSTAARRSPYGSFGSIYGNAIGAATSFKSASSPIRSSATSPVGSLRNSPVHTSPVKKTVTVKINLQVPHSVDV